MQLDSMVNHYRYQLRFPYKARFLSCEGVDCHCRLVFKFLALYFKLQIYSNICLYIFSRISQISPNSMIGYDNFVFAELISCDLKFIIAIKNYILCIIFLPFSARKLNHGKIAVTSVLIAASVLTSVICLEIKPGVHKYCREKSKVIDAEQVDEYLLVDAIINSSIVLECRFW